MTGTPEVARISIFAFVPLIAALLFALFGWGLVGSSDDLPSALIAKPVLEFSLPPVQGPSEGLSAADLQGQVSLVNAIASWCVPCRTEHPLFMEMSRAG